MGKDTSSTIVESQDIIDGCDSSESEVHLISTVELVNIL